MRMAWRNLWRNRRRTALALSAIGLSAMLVLAYTSILRAYGEWIVETITGPMLGHVQAHAPQWRKDRLMDRTLRGVDAQLAELRRDPDVASATARVYAPALAARGEEGFAVIVMGIDSRAESGAARLLTDVAEPLREREAFLGRQLAELMNVQAGDEVAVVGQGVDGSLANELFTVRAVVTTSVDLINRQGILIQLSTAQTLFAMLDEAHEIVIHARHPEMASALSRRIGGATAFAGTEVHLQAAFREKLGREFRQYVILGACNPPLAFSAINADPAVGLLLPCNVTVESVGDKRTMVRLTNPQVLLATAALGASPELASVARDASERMARVTSTLKQTHGVGD